MESMYLAHRSFFQRNLLAHQTMEYHFRKFSMHTGHTGGRGEGRVTNDFQQNLKESGEDERGDFGRLKMTVHFGIFWRFASVLD